MPPLIERRSWDEYEGKMRQVLTFDVKYDMGQLTKEERDAHLTRQLATPSEPTLHDVNRTGKWHMYSSPTLREIQATIDQG